MVRTESVEKRYVVYATILFVLLCRQHLGAKNCGKNELPVSVCPPLYADFTFNAVVAYHKKGLGVHV